jgi:hypothetical protein
MAMYFAESESARETELNGYFPIFLAVLFSAGQCFRPIFVKSGDIRNPVRKILLYCTNTCLIDGLLRSPTICESQKNRVLLASKLSSLIVRNCTSPIVSRAHVCKRAQGCKLQNISRSVAHSTMKILHDIGTIWMSFSSKYVVECFTGCCSRE